MIPVRTDKKATLAVFWKVTTPTKILGQGRPDEHCTRRSRLDAHRIRAGLHATDVSSFSRADVRRHSYHGATHRVQDSAHRRQLGSGCAVQLSSRAVLRCLVRPATA